MKARLGIYEQAIEPEETGLDIFNKATYDLDELKGLIDEDRFIPTKQARADAITLGYLSDADIAAEVMKLKKTDIYKTMESEKKPGLWQDVYRRKNQKGVELYIKLQKKSYGVVVIISFKKK